MLVRFQKFHCVMLNSETLGKKETGDFGCVKCSEFIGSLQFFHSFRESDLTATRAGKAAYFNS